MNANLFTAESLESRTLFNAVPAIEVGGAAQLQPRPIVAHERPIIYEIDASGGGGNNGTLNPTGFSAARRPTPPLAL